MKQLRSYKCRQHDRSAKSMTTSQFKSEILPHYESMHRVAVAMLGDSDEASDAVQDCMLKLWRSRDGLDMIINIRAYCIGAIRKTCLSAIEGRINSEKIESVTAENDTDVTYDRVEQRDSLEFVTRAIDAMPESHRDVMKLSSFGGLSNSEIADMTGLTAENVRQILSRGRKKLKTLFSKHS